MPCQPPTCEFSIYDEETAIDMAIFISPQYKDDVGILDAVYTYIDAVYNDIGWNVGIIGIEHSENDYITISEIIEENNDFHPLKACMMVGEDIDIAISQTRGGVYPAMVPCTTPWYLVGGEDTYTLDSSNHVVDEGVHINIPTSIVYPSYNDQYLTKKQQIISVFNKFSTNRNFDYGNDILYMENYQFDNCRQYQTYPPKFGVVTCAITPSEEELEHLITTPNKLFCINAHGSPHDVNLVNSFFNADEHAYFVNAPFIAFASCYSHGWYTNGEVTTKSLPPYDIHPHGWFGHSIFGNSHLRIMTTGSTTGHVLLKLDEKLAAGYTIAEAQKGTLVSTGWNVLYGDPTFHY